MLFTGVDAEAVARGEVTLAYRRWPAPRVVAGRVYRTNAGRLMIDSVGEVDPAAIDATDAASAGRADANDVRRQLRGDADWPTYRIEFHLVTDPDPREELAARETLDAAELDDLRQRLARIDAASRHGPWTEQTLRLIADRPATRAADLAELAGRDKPSFKLDVRKLKNLGLTHSLEVGYKLSARGRAYLAHLE